ncbi:MAG TPA: sigma 54-interacting transcriptional regulator, partial [Gemmatimonadaceae bacterium]|nr:sigma 54-interacting transcriptional regulator [Gemmatimonadaceae bacterium]
PSAPAGAALPPRQAPAIVGRSPALREALGLAERVAASRLTTVLLLGETGTGKELFARTIHHTGATADEPFVAVNCAAIPEGLLESELFGHEKGAFTDARQTKRGLFEVAGAGTLFLDEIGDMPSALQTKLLRALEERRVRRLGGVDEIRLQCRVIAGTNRALEDAVVDGDFREDLYYRLSVFAIELPALREREDDALLLAEHFLAERAREHGTPPQRLSEEAAEALRAHQWPGNIRELKNVIERAAILAPDDTILARHLVIRTRGVPATLARSTGSPGSAGTIDIPAAGKSLDDIEREAVGMTLVLTRGNVSQAARILGISRPTLLRKMRVHGMTRRSLLASS